MRAWVAALGIVFALAFLTVTSRAYTFTRSRWASGSTVTMHMQLGSGSLSLIDGATSWNQVGEWALAAWNGNANIAFGIVKNSSSGIGSDNDINNVYFSSTTPGGGSFGEGVLAVTATSYFVRSGLTAESDVAFNTAYSWNSYRGSRRSGVVDIYRVAVHEFGHVMGLDHPDDAGQSRTAIMNSRISDTDRLQNDDINGLVALYGSPVAANRPPSVTASCSPCLVASGNSVTLTASASDPDGDSLSYAWTVTAGGTIGNSGLSSTSWAAPFTVGSYTATVTVTDSRGASASSSVSITVTAADRLRSGNRLTSGQYIQSPNNRYRLIYQSDGNLVLYDTTTSGAVWWTSTSGTPGQAILQTDGNFVVYNAASAALWFTSTAGNSNAFLAVQSDRNVVVYSAAGAPLWHRLM
jgi:hypothetical protein